MATEVVMPQMGESIAEGTITKWLVQVGDTVEKDQPLFEISTDKVDAEIPSPAAGKLLEIKHEEGETVAVDEVVAVIGEEGEGGGASAPEPQAGPEEQEADAEEEAAEEGSGTGAAEGEAEVESRESAPEPPRDEPDEDEGVESSDEAERVRKYSSPLVRKIAKEEDVDLGEVEGTGIHGRVTKRDIMAYLDARDKGEQPKKKAAKPAAEEKKPAAVAPKARPAGAPAASPMPDFYVPAFTEGEDVEIETMSRIRQITAAHMRYSKDTSAHVTTVFHIDMTKVARVRARAKNAFLKAHGTKLTYMPFIFKAVAAALTKHKQVNASLDGDKIIYKKHVNLGMAVAMDKGLLVPVIKNAEDLNLVGLAKTANDLADRARSKKLGPDELKGGTFTITNPGVFGSLFGTPIINQPQVAILGIGTIEKRPIVVTDEYGTDSIAIRTMSYFGITYDHRLVDGADADHFMNDVKDMLEKGDWSELEPFL